MCRNDKVYFDLAVPMLQVCDEVFLGDNAATVTDVDRRKNKVTLDNGMVLNRFFDETNPHRYRVARPRAMFRAMHGNSVLNPSHWSVRNPANRVAGSEESDKFFINLLK